MVLERKVDLVGSIHISYLLWFCTHAQSYTIQCHHLLPHAVYQPNLGQGLRTPKETKYIPLIYNVSPIRLPDEYDFPPLRAFGLSRDGVSLNLLIQQKRFTLLCLEVPNLNFQPNLLQCNFHTIATWHPCCFSTKTFLQLILIKVPFLESLGSIWQCYAFLGASSPYLQYT